MAIKPIPEAIADARPVAFRAAAYPYTYAFDYLRDHPEVVPLELWDMHERREVPLSREHASVILREWAWETRIDFLDAAMCIAEAYLTEHRITSPIEVRQQIIEILARPA